MDRLATVVRAFTKSFHLTRPFPYDSRSAAAQVPYQAGAARHRGPRPRVVSPLTHFLGDARRGI